MSSGFSLDGSRPECFPFFQELYLCYALAENASTDCRFQYEDLQECRTHKKEYQRIRTIVQHQREKEKALNAKNNSSSYFGSIFSKLTT